MLALGKIIVIYFVLILYAQLHYAHTPTLPLFWCHLQTASAYRTDKPELNIISQQGLHRVKRSLLPSLFKVVHLYSASLFCVKGAETDYVSFISFILNEREAA